jgi:2,3-bisphosphoglycerate-independent phosphoglycerate mutase
MGKKVILIILDGWGIAKNPNVSAIDRANTPFMDSLYKKYPNAQLIASGLAVGLPEGQMGNSEVGHMNLGAGRIVYQDLVKINLAFENNEFSNEPVWKETVHYIKTSNKNLHFIGLVSDGGVHSHINHLKGLCWSAKNSGIGKFYVHAFTDGRDTDPKSGVNFLKELNKTLNETNGILASVIGRYYAMDRDNRWERIKLAYDLLVKGNGKKSHDLIASVKQSYQEGITDEFIKPIVAVDGEGNPLTVIKEGDAVLCFNFRTDRSREITIALTQKDFPEYKMKKLKLHYITMTNYDDTFQNINVIYDKENLTNTLGEVLAKEGKKQIRIAETEKYPHVTFFFSGGREKEFEGEKRILCPSPKVATYDLKPEMSAYEIKDAIIPEIKNKEADFICLNFANPDMVGHTGSMEAAIKACEAVDECTKEVVETALENDYLAIVLADHGNADCMINEDGSPNTAHTTQPVPIILVYKDNHKKFSLKNGKLGDVAPTILEIMGINKPKEMTGESLLC